MEIYCDSEDEQIKDRILNLITHVEVEPAHVSDAHALIPALESTKERGLVPEEVLADSLYGSDENGEKAKEMGVEIISPAMGTPKEETLKLGDFTQTENGRIAACPQGHVPVRFKQGKKNICSVAFDSEDCNVCPLRERCPVKPGRKRHYLRFDLKALRIAARRTREHTPEFKEKYRWRSGIESTFSGMDKQTGDPVPGTDFIPVGSQPAGMIEQVWMLRVVKKVFEDRVNQLLPMKREQTPEDTGWAAVFLASDQARNITGQALHVDGGVVM